MITIIKYKAMDKGALKAVFTIKVDEYNGLIFNEMKLFQTQNKRWISFASREYEIEGKKKHYQYNGFDTREMDEMFKSHVMKSLDEFIARDHTNVKVNNPNPGQMQKIAEEFNLF
jgi:hypothetical protein